MPKYLGTFQSWWGSWCWDTVHCRRLGLTQPHHKTTFLTGRWGARAILPATMATSQQRGKGFCCGIMGPRREVALLCAFSLCSQRTFATPSLVTDMALCLPTGTGQSVGMAAIYSAEASCRALSAAKDAGWAGRVKQLPSAILSAVMSQRQQSAIEQWQLTPFWDSKEKHRNEMGTKIPSHLALMGFWSFCASLPSLFSLVIIIQMKASYSDYFLSAPHVGLQSWV